jgi:hypothetical protein
MNAKIAKQSMIARGLNPCRWFRDCLNMATGTMPHPILKDVPICDRCREKVDKGREWDGEYIDEIDALRDGDQ